MPSRTAALLGALALAASAAVAPAALAKPGDAACVWTHLPEDIRADAWTSYQKTGAILDDDQLLARLEAALPPVLGACGASESEALGSALAGYAGRQLAARTLTEREGVTDARIAAAVARLPKADRDRFDAAAGVVRQDIPQEDRDVIHAYVSTVGKALAVKDEDLQQLAIWLVSDALTRHYDQ